MSIFNKKSLEEMTDNALKWKEKALGFEKEIKVLSEEISQAKSYKQKFEANSEALQNLKLENANLKTELAENKLSHENMQHEFAELKTELEKVKEERDKYMNMDAAVSVKHPDDYDDAFEEIANRNVSSWEKPY